MISRRSNSPKDGPAIRSEGGVSRRAALGTAAAAGGGLLLSKQARSGDASAGHLSDIGVVHVRVQSRKPFEALRSALENQLGPWRPQEFSRFMEAKTPEEFDEGVRSLIGPSGFMSFFIGDHNHYYSRLFGGNGGRVVMFVIGNASIARRIVARKAEAGLYVPLRIAVYENAAGPGELAYDLPSSLFAQFGDEGLTAIGRELDGRLETLAAAAVA
jgi:Domain of unknown function DUF302